MSVFGYDYLADHLGAGRTGALRLLRFQGERGGGGEYAYEVLNFVDGQRTVRDIRDAVSAVYGPVPVPLVAAYLEAHPKVAHVTYPGLSSHPLHEVAARQMKNGFSGMISFELKGGIPAGTKLMNAVELCALAESLGAVETMITHPATMTHAEVPENERW